MNDLLHFPSSEKSSTRLVGDAEARARALDIRTSCIVEAPAGSGKTGLLVQRYLKLLGDGDVEQAEEVLAITFTNKATAELRERVLRELSAASEGELPEEAKNFERETRALAISAMANSDARGWRLLEQPQRLNIRSIDSVCAEIANALPLLSGGGGPRQPVTNAQPLYRIAARRTMLQLGGDNVALHEALRTVLLHRDGNLADCEALVADMLQTREQWGELVPLEQGALDDESLDREARARLEHTLEGIVCAGLLRALRAMPAGALEELTSLAAQLQLEPEYKGESSPLAVCAGKCEPPGATADQLEHWVALIGLVLKKNGDWRRRPVGKDLKCELTKSEAAQLKQLVEKMESDHLKAALAGVLALPPAKYPDDQWTVAKALFHVLRRALAELRLLFAERQECDFTEFALAARAALRADEGASDASLSAGGRLRHLLVDEVQDTSSGQYELLELLTRSWDGHTQTMFLVGDPKQSIYLFRQARVERFLRTMKEGRLGHLELVPLQLTANFRSQAALVRDFNNTFKQLFPLPRDARSLESEGVDVPFVEASAVRAQTGRAGVVWHASVIDAPAVADAGDFYNRPEAKEARQIRRLIEKRLSTPLPAERTQPWRIAVLCRARTHLTSIIAEFKRNSGRGTLPYRAINLDPLDELPEVMDALALTRALLHPADRVAWLAVLHAPWCGLGLADLLRLTGDGGEADAEATVSELVRERTAMLSNEGQRRVQRVWQVLEQAVATMGRTTTAVQVERTWRSLGGDVALSEEQRENVLRYLGVVREVESDGGRVDLSVLAARLKDLYAEPVSGAAVNGKLPVDLMTIHKAKGLEWDVVFVPGLERGAGRQRSVLLNWLEFDGASESGDDASVVLAPIWQKGTESDRLSNWLNSVRTKRENAERKRVFYVAATRAQEEVHLFGSLTRSSNGTLRQPRHGSLLRACWPAAEVHFEAASQNVQDDAARPVRRKEGQMELALAASAEEVLALPTIQRMPLSFDPGARFVRAKEGRLSYPAASALRRMAAFERPEGSFTVRAFGNVVHRYLEVLARRLEAGDSFETVLAELPSWEPRLAASLRGEGLPPATVAREATRVARALSATLSDAVGRWIVAPHSSAASERMLTMASEEMRSLRVDRTFVAGDEPLSAGNGCIWIIDFKTTKLKSHTLQDFEAREKQKYSAQLEAYAMLRRALPDGHLPICLGLYYPMVPLLIHWLSGDAGGDAIR